MTQLIVSKQQERLNLKLHCSFTAYGTGVEKLSEAYAIADLAFVRLKYRQDQQSLHAIYISFKKHELSKTVSIIKMNITSQALNYSKQFYCSGELWTEWVHLGTSRAGLLQVTNIYVHSSLADISICVSTEKPEIYPKYNLFLKLYEDHDFTDFKLTAADGSVAVHKACLAASSDYFKGMFSGKWKETDEGSVDFEDVSRKNLQDLKDFIYLGKLPDDGLCSLIVLAKRFLIEDLIAACAKKLAETVVPENLSSLNEIACQNNIPGLTSAIIELTVREVVHKASLMKTKNKGEEAAALKEADKK